MGVPGLLIAAVRDLDPPAGGAEMSLATLLKGVTQPGPLEDAEVIYHPSHDDPVIDPGILRPSWSVSLFQSDARGEATDLTEGSEIERTTYPLQIEDLWSGLAWRLRGESGRSLPWLQRWHMRRANRRFARKLRRDLGALIQRARKGGLPVVGVTQLYWSAGAAEVFKENGVPYVVFVRDELQFFHPDFYRKSLENATAVCCAGAGLGKQVASAFNIKEVRNVRLPVDFMGRFGNLGEVEEARAAGLARRASANDLGTPRIAIVGVTPEKGYEFYHQLLPQLHEHWSEAVVDVYGGGAYAESLSSHPNVRWHGHTPVEEVFSNCDVHLLTVTSTGSWGRVINEAGLFGVPSVSIDIGSQREAVGEGGCVLSPKAKLEDWISALRSVYKNRDELGELARRHAGIVDHRKSIASFRSVIEDIAQG